MAENIDAERAAFEAAMPENHPRDRNMPDGSYNSPYLHVAWEVWQLARRTPSASIGEDGVPELPPPDVIAYSNIGDNDAYSPMLVGRIRRDAIAADRRVRGDVVDDLSMLVRQLVHSLKKAKPDSDLAARAVDYLQRKGLAGNPLRAAPPLSSEQQAEKGEGACGS